MKLAPYLKDAAYYRETYGDAAADNTRFVLTHVDISGELRVLTLAAQGQCTFETREAAEERMRLMEPYLRAKILGDRADTLRVLAVACWPGHNDPCCGVWEPEQT